MQKYRAKGNHTVPDIVYKYLTVWKWVTKTKLITSNYWLIKA